MAASVGRCRQASADKHDVVLCLVELSPRLVRHRQLGQHSAVPQLKGLHMMVDLKTRQRCVVLWLRSR